MTATVYFFESSDLMLRRVMVWLLGIEEFCEYCW